MSNIENNYNEWHVGQIYPQFRTRKDGYILEYSENGFILYAMLNGISDTEKAQFNMTKPFSLSIKNIEDISFFCFKFGDMEWADCPFSPALYMEAGKPVSFPELLENEGLALIVLLIDSSTGTLLHTRLIGLGHDLCLKWIEWANKKSSIPLSRNEYQRNVAKVYQRYSTTELVKLADLNWEIK